MYKIGFIGMGNMASAIAKGFVHSHFLSGNQICAYDLYPSQTEKVKTEGIVSMKSQEEVIAQSEFVFICVKPQVVERLLENIQDNLKNKPVVSIVLGYDFDKMNTLLDKSSRHIFVMPNTPVEVLEGMCCLESQHSLTEEEYKFVYEAFSHIGEVESMPSHLMGVAGALSGCGPAYLYMTIEALADGAVKNGLPRNVAYKLASQTVLGSGKMQRDTKLHPGQLKDNVCSPGGSTIRGVKALEKGHMRALFMDAIDDSLNR